MCRSSSVDGTGCQLPPRRQSDDSAIAAEPEPALPPFTQIRAFSVHIFTALGAALALAALIFAVRHNWPAMFICLGIALIVDGIDGTFARHLRVAELLPRWSGDVLDLVVDYTTYVFVPAYAIAAGGLMPEPVAIAAGMIIVVTGALYFADTAMKTDDNYFRGFPTLWNAVAFYLFILKLPPVLAAGCGGCCSRWRPFCRSSSFTPCGCGGCAASMSRRSWSGRLLH